MAQHYVYRFYAELKDYKPKIWRRFEINGEKTMAELGYALMLMFEMQASHLFCFNENVREALLANLRAHFSEEQIQKAWSKDEWNDFAKNVRYELPFEDSYLGDDERLAGSGQQDKATTDKPQSRLEADDGVRLRQQLGS